VENGTEYYKRCNEVIAKEKKKAKLERDLRKYRELISIHFNREVL
jgi:hypothetical protein